MKTITEQGKFRFWKKWTLQHTWVIPVSYVVSLIVILMLCAIFGISMNEFGSPLQQMVIQIAAGMVLGIGTGLAQKRLLQGVFDVPRLWIWFLVAGFVLTEAIAGFVCWRLHINRMQLRFLELNALPESLIFASAGLLIGLLQWSILREYFHRSIYWIFASAAGWGICIIIMDYVYLFPALRNSLLIYVIVFIIGAALYGAITGATFMWVLKKREIIQIQKPFLTRFVAFILRWL